MTDHGHFLGEHGYTGKPTCPQYDVLAHIPFLMYVPGHESRGAHVSGLSANVDVYATVLDLFGIAPPDSVQARSLLPLATGAKRSVRDWTLYGYFGRHVDITDGTYTYMRAPQAAEPELYVYSLRWEFRLAAQDEPGFYDRLELGTYMPNVDYPVGRIPVDPRAHEDRFENDNLLFNIDDDPGQDRNLAGGDAEARYAELLTRALREVGAPDEQFRRLGLGG